MLLICFYAALCLAWLIALNRCQQFDGGPDNVVVTVSHEAELFCNRSSTVDVQWKFRPPGSHQEQAIPVRHRSVTTSYGANSLVLENVQLSNAGIYDCRSVVGDDLKPAGAFLVVVAQKPCCHVDNVDSNQPSLGCSVTYAGQMNARLSLLAEYGSYMLLSRNFTAQRVASTHSVTAGVPVNSLQQTAYICRVEFCSNHSNVDVAKNQPRFVEGRCYLPFTRVNDSRADDGNIQTTDVSPEDAASVGYSRVTGVCLFVIALLVLVIVVLVALYCVRRRLESCLQSVAAQGRSAMFQHCCGDIAARHTNDCDATGGNQSLHAQVSPEHADSGIEATLPAEDHQLLVDSQGDGVGFDDHSTDV